jgi:uncharacterized protein (TIGR03437 family)
MKTYYLLPVFLLGAIGHSGMWMAQSTATSTPASAPNTAGAAQGHATAGYARLPMSFEPCFEAMCAEAGSQAKYFSRGSGHLLFLTPTEAVLDAGPSKESTLSMKLLRSNSRASMQGLDPLPGKSNYFIGKNPKNWRSNVTNYAKVRYRNVYRGVDLVYYGNGSMLEYDFVVAPRADPRAIALTFPGARRVSIDQAGDLVLATDRGKIVQRKPRVWQQAGESKREIAARYAVTSRNEVGFELDHYDASAALVIDPVLVYSTFLNGFNSVIGAVDGAGNVYVNLYTGGRGSFIKKLDPSGTSVIYSTYVGGTNSSAIALDATGNVYVTGFAYTPDFPATPGAFQTQIAGDGAPFIAKVNATGTSLVYATFLSPSDGASLSGDLQGPPFVSPCCIAVDSAGSAYVTGTTRSKNFPTTPGAFQAHWDAGWSTFVTKLNPTGTALAYSTYLGGSGPGALLFGMSQEGTGIAVDTAGNAYVSGWTGSNDFPTTPGALQFPGSASYGGFVSKLNPTGSSLVYSTQALPLPTTTVTVDAAGNAYVAGYNLAGELPLTAGAFDDGGNSWLAKINPAGTALVYAAHLSVPGKIFVDADGDTYFAGYTSSPDLPTTPGALQKVFAGGHPFDQDGYDSDAFVTKLNAAGTALIYSTYLGGKGDDLAWGVGLDAAGNFYVTGSTESPDFPTTTGASQASPAGSAFLAKLDLPSAAAVPLFQPSSVVNAASYLSGPVAPGEIITVFGTGFGPGPLTTLRLTGGLVNTTLGGTRVLFDGVPAPLIYTVEDQLTVVVPYAVAGKSSTQMQVEYRGSRSAAVTLQLAPVSPAIFTLDSSGRGAGAILNQDSSVNSPANPARIGSVVSFFATGEGQTSPSGVDGKPGSDPVPRPILSVSVTISGQTVTPIYAGGAPGNVAGLMQVNVQVPSGIQTGGAVPVLLKVGNESSQAGVTIAVR